MNCAGVSGNCTTLPECGSMALLSTELTTSLGMDRTEEGFGPSPECRFHLLRSLT